MSKFVCKCGKKFNKKNNLSKHKEECHVTHHNSKGHSDNLNHKKQCKKSLIEHPNDKNTPLNDFDKKIFSGTKVAPNEITDKILDSKIDKITHNIIDCKIEDLDDILDKYLDINVDQRQQLITMKKEYDDRCEKRAQYLRMIILTEIIYRSTNRNQFSTGEDIVDLINSIQSSRNESSFHHTEENDEK